MQILVAALVKNEAARFLPSAVKAWGSFADNLLVIDDHSEDESVLVCQSAGAEVLSSGATNSAWGDETPLRVQLWEEACKRTSQGDYIFVLDADMVPARNPRPLFDTEPDAVTFPLFDLWAEYSDGMLMYRTDGFWQGHKHPRLWAVRKPAESTWKWSGRGIHSGHFPQNLNITKPVFAPADYGLLHYAYKNNTLRQEKYAQYRKVAAQLSPFERKHAQSILDQNPKLSCLDFSPEYTLKCAS